MVKSSWVRIGVGVYGGVLRVHRGYIINPNYVKEYNPEEESIMMANDIRVEVSRRKKYILKGFTLKANYQSKQHNVQTKKS